MFKVHSLGPILHIDSQNFENALWNKLGYLTKKKTTMMTAYEILSFFFLSNSSIPFSGSNPRTHYCVKVDIHLRSLILSNWKKKEVEA
jgi:hypothetical protein